MDRRRFIVAGLTGTAVSCARSKSPWRFFSVEEARTVEAVCAHIIPQDQDPGAVQAGVVVFIDRQLPRFYKPLQKTYRQGIAAIDHERVGFAGRAFADLPATSQLDMLRRIERNPGTKPFFDLLVAGFRSMRRSMSHRAESRDQALLRPAGRARHAGFLWRSAAWRQSGARKLEDARRGVSAVAGARVNRVNAVVVGAGAAGGIVAKELAEAGLSVVLLERGKWY